MLKTLQHTKNYICRKNLQQSLIILCVGYSSFCSSFEWLPKNNFFSGRQRFIIPVKSFLFPEIVTFLHANYSSRLYALLYRTDVFLYSNLVRFSVEKSQKNFLFLRLLKAYLSMSLRAPMKTVASGFSEKYILFLIFKAYIAKQALGSIENLA